MFEGSPNIPRGQFSSWCRCWRESECFHPFDKTVYFITVPSNQIERAMWLESERMLQLKIDSVGVETQRGVVKEERTGASRISRLAQSRKTMNHSFKVIHIGGRRSALHNTSTALTVDEFRPVLREFLCANNACLVIAGDIDVEKTRGLVQKYYGDIPRSAGAIYRPSEVEPPQTAEVRIPCRITYSCLR